MGWIPIITLPNVNVKPIEGNHAAIVGYYDKRLAKLRGEHPAFKRFLSRFRDDFGRIHRPSVLLLNEDKFEAYAQSEAVSAFRDLASICVVPYNRAWVLKHGMHGSQEPTFSNSFAFYPWMIDRHYKGLIASTPAILGDDEPDKFKGRISPEIVYRTASDRDETLLRALIERWEVRFATANPEWKDRALFRSLNMAFHASQTPFDTIGTPYDGGRLVGLWVSAFEILAHGGPSGGHANKAAVLKVLNRSNPASAQTRSTVYDRLNRTRNDYLHGNPPHPNLNANILSNYGGVLYRLMLTEFLGLHYTIPKIRRSRGWEKRMGQAVAEYIEFNGHQERYEDALDTYLNPQPRRGITHRRRARRSGDPAGLG